MHVAAQPDQSQSAGIQEFELERIARIEVGEVRENALRSIAPECAGDPHDPRFGVSLFEIRN